MSRHLLFASPLYQDNSVLMGMGILEYSECADMPESSLLTDAIVPESSVFHKPKVS